MIGEHKKAVMMSALKMAIQMSPYPNQDWNNLLIEMCGGLDEYREYMSGLSKRGV